MGRSRSLTAALAAALVLGACGKEPKSGAATNGAATPGGVDHITIAMIAKASTNPLFLVGRNGADAAAKELSAKDSTLKVDVVWMTPPQEDGQVQAQRIAQAVNEGVDAVLISASDAGKVAGAIDDAVARGVAVMTFDSDVPQSKRFAYYGVDDEKVGRQVMSNLAELMHGKGTVAILAGNQNAPNLQRRTQGVRDEAAKYPGITIVDAFHHAETPQDAAAEVVRVDNAYPNVNGWAMIGGWALFTKSLLTDLDPSKMTVVSVDGLPAELPYVEKGIAPVLLAQPVYDWGYVGVKTIVDRLHYHKDVPEIIPMETVKVTKDNLGDWARTLKSWGFDNVPQKYLDMK
jgi:ribose transport system substrate-binding protein